MTIAQEITLSHFEDVIVTALEGGSNYWYLLNTDEFRSQLPEKAGTYNTLSEKISAALFNDANFKMPVRDIENEDEILGYCTRQSMMDAFEKTLQDRPEIFARFMDEGYDAGDADYVFQLAVMGTITFG